MIKKLFNWSLLVTFVFGVSLMASAKKVHTLGDSTMAPYDEQTTNTRGWGMYFGNFLTNGWTSVNYAKGGRDSRGGFNELWQNAKNNVEAGDYVLIQFAHNDEKYNGIDNLELQDYYSSKGDAENAAAVKNDGRGTVPSTTYKQCLKQIVDAVKAKGATPVLVSAVCRCYFSGSTITKAGQHNLADKYDAIVNGEIKTGLKLSTDDHSMDYSYQMKQLAQAENVAFIDMTEATKDLYESYKSYDNCYAALFDKGGEVDKTHYNLTGALTAARLCAQMMKDQGILADAIEVPTDLSFNPSAADMGEVYVGQTATKELTLSGLGITPSSGTATITATEGILLSADKENWQSSLTADYQNGTLVKTFYAKVSIAAAGLFAGTVTAVLGDKTVEVPVTVKGIELGGGAPFTVQWVLTANDDPAIEGPASAAAAKVEGMVKYGNTTTNGILVSTSDGGAWVKAEDDSPNQYVQFTVTAPDGQALDINRIAMKVGGRGGNGMRCHVYYSTDGFVTRTTIYAPSTMSSGVMNEVESAPVIKLQEGDQLLIRVYPWYTGNATGKWLCVQDVVVSGQSKDAAGVNIQGTITYALDKGGLNQGDDAVMDPNELSAGFAGKSWTAGSGLTVENVLTYTGANSAKTPQTRIYNGTGSSLPSSATVDNTLTLTLIPEDGFSFVPTKVSFQAARYGTDGGYITCAVEAGATNVTLVNNGGVNRSDKGLDIATFSEEVNGVTATAENPLKLNFSFLGLGNTKQMGLSNLVIEGTLVGAAAQVTKYALTTQVLPAGAGAISRDPDMEQYKEGSTVTLKATKNFGYKFTGWQDADGNTVATDAETTVTMDAAKTMMAMFEAVPVYKVTTEVTNDAERELGSVTLTPNDHDGQYEEGTKITAVANESKILKFLSWTDKNENAGAPATRELTVSGDMLLVANYEVQDFVAVFDASTTASYAYATTAGYPFSADQVWDAERNAKSCVVKVSDGSLCYTQDGGTPVVRNRESVVLSTINGLYQNGYRSSDIAFQFQFSTKGFESVQFTADMAAKNMAHKYWKALLSTDGTNFTQMDGAQWEMTANSLKPLAFDVPAGQDLVVIRITGDGTDMLSDKYAYDKQFDGLDYSSNSECGVGNVFVLGTAEVIADDAAPVVTATVPADKAAAVSATGKITISFDERIQPAAGAAAATLTVDGGAAANITPSWSNRSVSFDYSALTYGQQYTFQMPAGYVQDLSGNKAAEAVTITFTVMDRPVVAKGMYDFIVPDDGTITQALAAANNRDDKTVRYRVFIKNSTEPYVFDTNGTTVGGDGNTYPDPRSYLKAANTSFIGESMEGVVITNITPDATWNNGYGQACPLEGIGNGDVLIIQGSATGSYFQNLTIKSSMGDKHGRDIALNDQATNTIFKDACLWAYQDTYKSGKGKYYFEGGVIRGRTDFICGGGDAFFNKVDIIMCESGGYIVAPQDNSAYGYVFKDCTIKSGASGVNGNYYLGRAWSAAAETYYINTTMEVQPKNVGWSEWNNGPTRFAEYKSVTKTGAAVSLTDRATTINGTPNSPVLTDEEAAVIGDIVNSFGDWQPMLATEQAPVPTGVKADGAVLTWDNSDYALLWAVCKDGSVVAFTSVPTYTATENGAYTVRAANEMGGLSAASLAVTVSGATGIEAVHGASVDTTSLYDLNGRRLNQAPTQKGVYIQNGRKVIVK